MLTREDGCRDEPVTIVEVVMDCCSRDFGNGLCTATGVKCYNTWNTCKDQCNFDCKTKSYWFSSCRLPNHLGIANYTPNIKSVQSSPTKLELGKAFSTRGRIQVCFQDEAHTDQGFDPYWPRGATPIVCATDMPGTLFGRWRARAKFFENRRVNVYHGYCDQALCEMTQESYFIESIKGPSSTGVVCFVLKDPLIFLEDKTAKCPSAKSRVVATQTIGQEYPLRFTLQQELFGPAENEGDGNPYEQIGGFLLRNNYLAGDPKQDAFFARLRHVCIGSETLAVAAEINTATPSGWNIRLLDRAVCGSELKGHKAGKEIIAAETIQNEHISAIICRFLTECSELSDIAIACCEDEVANLIDFDSLEQMVCDAPLAYVCETIICKATGMTTLLNELAKQFLFHIYFDSSVGKIRSKVFKPPACDLEPLHIRECDKVKDTLSAQTSESRVSQVTFYYDTENCAESPSKENSNSVGVAVTADSLKEPCDRREFKTQKEDEVISRWINQCNCYVAPASSERWLFMRSCPAENVTLDLDYHLARQIPLGDFITIEDQWIQDVDGLPSTDLFFVKGKHYLGGCYRLTAERMPFKPGEIAPQFNCDSGCPTLIKEYDRCDPASCLGVW